MIEKVSCVILNYNDADSCIKLIKKIIDYNSIYRIVVVDNKSTDDSVIRLSGLNFDKLSIISTAKNGGYGYGNNYGIREALKDEDIDKVLVCNPDVSFEESLLDRLTSTMNELPNCGLVSSLQLNKNGKEFRWCAWDIPSPFQFTLSLGFVLPKVIRGSYLTHDELHASNTIKVDCVSGSLLMLSRDAFLSTGGYDESIFLYCEETVLGCKLKNKGFSSYICTDTYYQHFHSVSINKTFKRNINKRKVLLKSHRYVIKKYLYANWLLLLFDVVFAKLTVFEEYSRSFFEKVFTR